MRWTRITMLTLAGGLSLLAAACYEPASGDQTANLSPRDSSPGEVPTATPVLVLPAPVILSIDTPTPVPARPVLPTATPLAAPSEAESTPTPAPSPSATAPPSTPPEPTATPPPAEAVPPTVIGSPFTDTDLVAALVGRGLSYAPQSERVGCAGRAVAVRHLGGSSGPPVTLWVYPTSDDLKADWILRSSGAPRPTIAGCEVDGGWIYWYENLVMAFEPQAEWIPEPVIRSTIVEAFFALRR